MRTCHFLHGYCIFLFSCTHLEEKGVRGYRIVIFGLLINCRSARSNWCCIFLLCTKIVLYKNRGLRCCSQCSCRKYINCRKYVMIGSFHMWSTQMLCILLCGGRIKSIFVCSFEIYKILLYWKCQHLSWIVNTWEDVALRDWREHVSSKKGNCSATYEVQSEMNAHGNCTNSESFTVWSSLYLENTAILLRFAALLWNVGCNYA